MINFSRYQIVGARADNIELRPLGYESDEEDIVFDASSRNWDGAFRLLFDKSIWMLPFMFV